MGTNESQYIQDERVQLSYNELVVTTNVEIKERNLLTPHMFCLWIFRNTQRSWVSHFTYQTFFSNLNDQRQCEECLIDDRCVQAQLLVLSFFNLICFMKHGVILVRSDLSLSGMQQPLLILNRLTAHHNTTGITVKSHVCTYTLNTMRGYFTNYVNWPNPFSCRHNTTRPDEKKWTQSGNPVCSTVYVMPYPYRLLCF